MCLQILSWKNGYIGEVYRMNEYNADQHKSGKLYLISRTDLFNFSLFWHFIAIIKSIAQIICDIYKIYKEIL